MIEAKTTVRLEFKLEDLWVGIFWEVDVWTVDIWICIIPCFPIHIQRTERTRPIEPEEE